ncbi:MAG: class II aldolase/adducin family protein [Solimonas sp.]
MTASSLVKIDLHGNKVMDPPHAINPAGFTIHSAIHAVRPDAQRQPADRRRRAGRGDDERARRTARLGRARGGGSTESIRPIATEAARGLRAASRNGAPPRRRTRPPA